MPTFSYLKRVLCSSPYRRHGGISAANLGILFRVSDFFSSRAFSSVQDVETRDRRNQDELRTGPVVNLLNGYGFTVEQRNKISKSFPTLLSYAEKTLSPKLGFLRSVLGSDDDLTRVITGNPKLLAASLKNQPIPNHKFIKSILARDDLVVKSIKRLPRILLTDVENNLAAKVSFLRESGVPHSSVARLLEYSPRTFSSTSSKLEESMKKAISLGFKPSNPMIVPALRAVNQINESTWDRKMEVYRRWGWSNNDFLSAFKKQPFCMCLSEKKINQGMDLFVNRIGLSSSDIAKYPTIISFSLEKRIIPRCSVLAVLLEKGVLGLPLLGVATYYNAVVTSEKAFVERYVDRYPEHVLELWKKLIEKAAI